MPVSSILPRRLAQVALVAAFALTAYAQVFLFPFTPRMPWGDEVLFLIGGQKLAAGQTIYRDFFELVFPGADVYYATLIRAFGSRAWIPGATLVLLGTAIAITTTAIASRIMPRRKAVLAGLLFLAFPFYAAPIATHHWFSTELVLLALLAVLKRGRFGLVAGGALCGLASFFTQTKGVAALAAICLWLLWRREIRQSLAVAASFAVTLSAAMLPFVAQAGLGRVYENTFVYVLNNYTAEWFNTWRIYLAISPRHAGVLDIPEVLAFLVVHAAVPFAYLAWALRRRNSDAEHGDTMLLVAGVGLALFLAVASAPNLLRLSTAAAPALILAASMLEGRVVRWATVAVLAIVVLGVAARQRSWQSTTELPIGRVAVNSQAMQEEMEWLMARTTPGQPCFGNHVVCFNLGLRNAAPAPFVMPSDYTPPEQAEAVTRAIDREKVPLLVLRPVFYMPVERGAHDHLQNFRQYLYANYRMAKVFANGDEAWVRTR